MLYTFVSEYSPDVRRALRIRDIAMDICKHTPEAYGLEKTIKLGVMLYNINEKALADFLDDHPGKIPVMNIINNISIGKDMYRSVMLDIARDAVRIDMLGPSGLRRYRDHVVLSDSTHVERCVMDYCHNTLITLREKHIKTARGRELSKPGHEYIANYMDL